MKGRLWIVLGILAGVAVGLGKVPYLAGAATSWAETAERAVRALGLSVIHRAARGGAAKRAVEGLSGLFALLLPGLTALLLLAAGRAALALRAVACLLVAALGVGAFFYLPGGRAGGVLALALAVSALILLATGPLLVAPLAALAALIGTVYLPRLLSGPHGPMNAPISRLHEALFASTGSPLWLQVVALVVAALPFAGAARLALSS